MTGGSLHEISLVGEIDDILRIENVRPEGIDRVISDAGVNLDEELPRAGTVEYTGVGEEDIHEPRILVQSKRVLSFVRQERANVYREVLLVRQRRQQRQGKLVVVRRLVQVRRETIVFSQRLCNKQ